MIHWGLPEVLHTDAGLCGFYLGSRWGWRPSNLLQATEMGPKTGGFPHLFTALDHIKDPFIFGSHEQQRDDYHREPHQRKQRWVKIDMACHWTWKNSSSAQQQKKHTALKLNKTSLKKKHKSHQNVSFRIPKRSHPFSQTALEAAILVSRAPAKGAGHLGCILSSQDLAYQKRLLMWRQH